jgi:sialate O-acetylesterase
MKKIFLAIVLLICLCAEAQVKLASIFADDMVLQREAKIPIWGWAMPNEKVTVTFHNQSKTTKADHEGKWSVRLNKENAGGPYNLSITGKNQMLLKNILVGEVWLCSGQSNMEWTVGQSDDAENEIAKANNSNIRHIKIPKEINSMPNADIKKTAWEVCSPETVGGFTGIGYFYAKQLQEKLHIPIGLINASWGGTNIETWISREGFESSTDFQEMIAKMPKINLQSLLNLKMSTEQNRIATLQKYPFTTDKVALYKKPDFDDKLWLTLQQPQIWEEQSLGNFDGVVWLRKHFTLSKEDLNTEAILQIPAIDDNDITYLNGIKIGATKGWDIKRNYIIPAGLLREGVNVIAIQVIDNGGGGGIHGSDSDLKLVLNNASIALNGLWQFQVETIKNSINENGYPSLCYNAMIHPLIPFAFKGVLWYQGESNASRAFQYNKTFPLLINDWRQKWQTKFPFYFVQLATFKTKGNSNEGCSWAELREAQTHTLKVSHTAMVVTTDIGNPNDIHPTNKKEVGKRLAAIAFNNLYNKKTVCSGPVFKTFENKGNQTIVTFDTLDYGLMVQKNNGLVYGFEVANNDQVFYPAKAIIRNNTVMLTCDQVVKPQAIRYGWIGDASACNLFNNEGFPAIPFRTDNWKTVTKNVEYRLPE